KNTLKFNSGLINKRLLFDARVSRISSDGFIERASSDLKSYYFSAAYLAGRSDFRFTTFAGKEKTYQAWYGVTEEDLKLNRRVNYAGTEKAGAPYDNEIDDYNQAHYQLFFNHRFTPSLVFNTGLFLVRGKGFYEQYKAGEAYADYGMPDAMNGATNISNTNLVRQLWLDNYYYGDVFSLLYQQGKTSLTFGGTVAQYAGDHYGKVTWAEQGLTGTNRWYDTDASKSDLTIFGKWQQNLGSDFHLYGDLQWRKVAYALNGFRDNPALITDANYSFINPKAGVTYIKNNWNAFASFGVANKEPNRDDFEAGLKEQPLPERLHDFELGFQHKMGKTQLSTTLYYMNYKNQLVLTGRINDVGAYTRTNIDNSYRAGIELQASLEPASWLKASGNIALSRNRVKDFIEFIDDYDAGGQRATTYNESHLSFSPAVVGGATLTLLPYKQLELALTSKYVSKQYLDNTANESRKLDPFFTQDIRAQYAFSGKRFKNITLVAQVFNAFNAAYEPNGYTFSYYSENKLATENFYFPMAGTNWLVGVNVKL
ncbi:MAG TPA: TonB-dependent receptor, partial [Flavisolibacter sp.]